MALHRALITGPPLLNCHALSREFCRCDGCFKPDTSLTDMIARVPMRGFSTAALKLALRNRFIG
ncbi:MAG: hypothetical protein OXH63_24385 [Gemmatimonadetes bacterium]|nr:hypothetical protein [Gemmatimonadota bacterium]